MIGFANEKSIFANRMKNIASNWLNVRRDFRALEGSDGSRSVQKLA